MVPKTTFPKVLLRNYQEEEDPDEAAPGDDVD